MSAISHWSPANQERAKALIDQYPDRRSAVMPLLYIAQSEDGYVTKGDMAEIGEILGITSTDVASIVGFYTLYYDQPEGEIRVQVCADHTEADIDFALDVIARFKG